MIPPEVHLFFTPTNIEVHGNTAHIDAEYYLKAKTETPASKKFTGLTGTVSLLFLQRQEKWKIKRVMQVVA